MPPYAVEYLTIDDTESSFPETTTTTSSGSQLDKISSWYSDGNIEVEVLQDATTGTFTVERIYWVPLEATRNKEEESKEEDTLAQDETVFEAADRFMEQLTTTLLFPCFQEPTRLKSALRSSADSTATPQQHSVKFNQIDIREFDMTLGDHPLASSGPPVMLDQKPRSVQVVDLEQYEKARQPRRERSQLRLTFEEREGILLRQQGFKPEEVIEAWKEALEIRKQRKQTLQRGLLMSKWDEAWESSCRKMQKVQRIILGPFG